MPKQDLLFEILCEELPAHGLKQFAQQLMQQLMLALQAAVFEFGCYRFFVTPRRIALQIDQLAFSQPSRQMIKRGPPVDAPASAVQGFLRGLALPDTALIQRDNYWYVEQTILGQTLIDQLPSLINRILLPVAGNKWMRWANHMQPFWRPVNSVVLLWGEQVISATILGCKTDRLTLAHRGQSPAQLVISHASVYAELLAEEGMVIADFTVRQTMIEQQLVIAAQQEQAHLIQNAALLEEVTGLIEWPQALVCQFDKSFLQVPKEVLISAMQQYQKCFALTNQSDKLLPQFITIANTFSQDVALIKQGNERVMQARLSDAAFFWQQDQQKSWLALAKPLTKIVFQQQLGTVADKIQRLRKLSKIIAKWLNVDPAKAQRVAELSKLDLTSAVVNEFPELQGTLGYYLAQHHAEPEEIALAIRDQYLPLPQQAALPKNALGCVIALADRIDTLAGIFGIGLLPTGDKDPFALRRAANGIIRLIIEKSLTHVYLDQLIVEAFKIYQAEDKYKVNIDFNHAISLEIFILGRLPAYFEAQAYTKEMIMAVLSVVSPQQRSLVEIAKRLQALADFMKNPANSSLSVANKRVKNIAKKNEAILAIELREPALANLFAELVEDTTKMKDILHKNDAIFLSLNIEQSFNSVDPNLFLLAEETALYHQAVKQKALLLDYQEKLTSLSVFKQPLENFFNHVMVEVDDPVLKRNRLALLQCVRALFLQVADISLLVLS